MPISEAARADLYNGLADVLGPERAETLMTSLPRYDPAEVATKGDVAAVKSDIDVLTTELRSEMHDGLAAVNQRLDRLFLTLLAGVFVIVAAMAGVVFTAIRI